MKTHDEIKWRKVLIIWLIFIVIVMSIKLFNCIDNRDEAVDEWLENSEYKEEVVGKGYSMDSPNLYYVRLENNKWLKLTLKKDFWGDWDVVNAEEIPFEKLPEWIKK